MLTPESNIGFCAVDNKFISNLGNYPQLIFPSIGLPIKGLMKQTMFWTSVVVKQIAETIEACKKLEVFLGIEKYFDLSVRGKRRMMRAIIRPLQRIYQDAGGICQDRLHAFGVFKVTGTWRLPYYWRKSKLVRSWNGRWGCSNLSDSSLGGSTFAKLLTNLGWNFGGCWRVLGFKMSLTTWPTLPWKNINKMTLRGL